MKESNLKGNDECNANKLWVTLEYMGRSFWKRVNYLLNKILHKQQDKTPYELWKSRAPSYKFLRV